MMVVFRIREFDQPAKENQIIITRTSKNDKMGTKSSNNSFLLPYCFPQPPIITTFLRAPREWGGPCKFCVQIAFSI